MLNTQMTVIFLGNGRCYHTLDWFRSAQNVSQDNPPILVTDLIESESFEKLIRPTDMVVNLFILDKFLLKKQSWVGNVWRNLVKLLVLPIQIILFRRLVKKYLNPVIHAHSMYYVMIARFSSCNYVATPQGSEILVRPYNSKAYKLFSLLALYKSSSITVDSISMQEDLSKLFGRDSILIQNGIDINAINQLSHEENTVREKVVSIRAIDPNYQIDCILEARNRIIMDLPIYFCYPFVEMEYKNSISSQFITIDHDIGRLPRIALYKLLLATKLVISIPISDSSPRSVYEAIFCGCIVATTYCEWIDLLPVCMLDRLIVVDLKLKNWLQEALDLAETKSKISFIPSQQALEIFDQQASMLRLYNEVYPVVMSCS